MRSYLYDAKPEVFEKLARLSPERREATLQFCDKMFDVLDEAREQLSLEDFRQLLVEVVDMLKEKTR